MNTEHERIAVVPYKHQISHKLKKIEECAGVHVLLFAPFKLISLTKSTNPLKKLSLTKCRTRYRQCTHGVVYRTPFPVVLVMWGRPEGA